MDMLPSAAKLGGSLLLAIGFINDTAVGSMSYSDASNTTLANAVSNTNPTYTVEDVRKTTSTSIVLKIIGGILLTSGFALDMYMKSKGDTLSKQYPTRPLSSGI